MVMVMALIDILTVVGFLHNLFTAMWIGGMFMLLFTVLPTVKKIMGPGPESKKLVNAIRERLSKFTYVAIIGLVLTGIPLSLRSPGFQGFFAVGDLYSMLLTVKHVAVILMVVIALLRSLYVPSMKIEEPKRMKIMTILLVTNLLMGMVVLYISSYLAAIVQTMLTP